MVSEKFYFKTQNFTKNVWIINVFATQQFRSFLMAGISFNIAYKELKKAQIATLAYDHKRTDYRTCLVAEMRTKVNCTAIICNNLKPLVHNILS